MALHFHGKYRQRNFEYRPSLLPGPCTIPFGVAERHRPLTCPILLIDCWTEANVREQLAQGCYLKAERSEIELATFELQV